MTCSLVNYDRQEGQRNGLLEPRRVREGGARGSCPYNNTLPYLSVKYKKESHEDN